MKELLNQHKLIIISLLTVLTIGLIVFFCIYCISCASEIEKIENWRSNFTYPVWKQGDYSVDYKIGRDIFRVFSVEEYDLTQGNPARIFFLVPKTNDKIPLRVIYGNWDFLSDAKSLQRDKILSPYFFFYSEQNDLNDISSPMYIELRKHPYFYSENTVIIFVKLDSPSRKIKDVRIGIPTMSASNDDLINTPEGYKMLPESFPLSIDWQLSSSILVTMPLPATQDAPKLLSYVSKTLFRLFTRKISLPPKGVQLFSFILKNYLLFLVIIFLFLFIFIRITNQYSSLKIEAFSVLSFMALVLNYVVLEFLSRFRDGSIGLPAVGRGDSELLSFLGGCLAVFLGHVAMLKIRRNKYKGKKMAVIGLIGGYLCVSFWIGLLVVLAIGMSGF